jgi:CheY-like chemotaxis protein
MTIHNHLLSTDADTILSVLVVDDLETNRNLMCRRLEKFGYRVVAVDSGPSALMYLEKFVPDIVLLDYMMPHMNGLEVLDRLRANEVTRYIPVIMVTARAEAESVVEALDRGVDDYVTKPIDFDVLRARMLTHIEKRREASDMAKANSALDQRVTIRAIALADMDSELQREIQKRKNLEMMVDQTQSTKSSCQEHKDYMSGKLTMADEKLQQLYDALIQGKPCNPAGILRIRSLVGEALCTLTKMGKN